MGKELQEFVGEGEGKRGWGGEMEEICNEERRGGEGEGGCLITLLFFSLLPVSK